LVPGGRLDADEFRRDDVSRLAAVEGTKYFRGGESAGGIDCSGLPRCAYLDALLAYAMRHLDRNIFRRFAEQWWFDASARSLAGGYRGYTVPIDAKGTIGEMKSESMPPRDLAVTTCGVHALVYAGAESWT